MVQAVDEDGVLVVKESPTLVMRNIRRVDAR